MTHDLCGNCGSISPTDEWTGWKWGDDGLVPVEPGDYDPIWRCPRCGYDHTDDDADPGVWDGTELEMHAQRRELLADFADYADEWADALHEANEARS